MCLGIIFVGWNKLVTVSVPLHAGHGLAKTSFLFIFVSSNHKLNHSSLVEGPPPHMQHLSCQGEDYNIPTHHKNTLFTAHDCMWIHLRCKSWVALYGCAQHMWHCFSKVQTVLHNHQLQLDGQETKAKHHHASHHDCPHAHTRGCMRGCMREPEACKSDSW